MKRKLDLRKNVLLFFLLITTMSTPLIGATNDIDVNKLISNICEQNESNVTVSSLNSLVKSQLRNLNTSTGAFSDINMSYTGDADWQPIYHLERLRALVLSYTMKGSEYYESDVMYNNILNVLEYWYQKKPTSVNWWWNQIAVPKSLGVSLIQMRKGKKQLPASVEKKHIDRLAANAADPSKKEGLGLTNVATDIFYRAVLNADDATIDKAINYALNVLKIVDTKSDEYGIRCDNSYQQHTHQLYIGGYGEELIGSITEFAINLYGTKYELKGDKLDILSNFVRNAYIPEVRGQFIHYNVMGRSVSRKDAVNKSHVASFIERMKKIDPTYTTVYDNASKRLQGKATATSQVDSKNTVYYVSDYAHHSRSAYSFGVRAVSDRTSYVEKADGENIKGYFMSYGNTVTTLNGDEYRDIFPVWNWTRIPGVTNPQVTTIPQRRDWGVLGTGKFTGGVSDGMYGAMTFVNEDAISGKTTKVKKSWFMFDDEIVNLGSGITSNSTFPINTTVEQSLLNGNITVSNSGSETVIGKGEQTFSNGVDWVYHNRIGYYFPNKGNIKLINNEQSGSWRDINTSYSSTAIRKNVFTLYFDHGTNPSNSTYAYITVPNKSSVEAVKSHKIDNIAIHTNNDKMQVVEHSGLGMWMMVFFEAGKFQNSKLQIEVDKPCVIMLKNVSSPKATMLIADPSQNRSKITVKTGLPGNSGKTVTTVCDLSTLDVNHAGAAKSYTIESTGVTEDKNEQKFNVTLPQLVGASFNMNAGVYEVEKGKDFAFSLVLNSNYSNSNPTVKANGVIISPTSTSSGTYQYKLQSVSEDITISVEGLSNNTGDYTLKSIRINGEYLSNIEQAYYLVDCNSSLTTLNVVLDFPTGVYTNVKNNFTVDVSKPVLNEINIEIGKSKDQIMNTYKLTIEKRFHFNDIVTQKNDKQLSANNNPMTNGGFIFEEYTWLKNGVVVGKGQIYSEPNNANLDTSAQYQLAVKTSSWVETPPMPDATVQNQSGNQVTMELKTCPSKITLQSQAETTVYPANAKVGETLTVDLGDPSLVGTGTVYNLLGYKLLESKIYGKISTPLYTAGIFIIRVEVNNNVTTHKVIVK